MATTEETVIELENNLPELPGADATAQPNGAEATGEPIEPRALRKRVLGLAGPIIGENFLETLLGIIDTWLVAGLGAMALAGVGSALQVMFLLIAALSALAIGSAVLVAQAVGARDLARAGHLGRQSLMWSVIFSIPLALGGLLFSAPLIGMFGLEPDVARVGTQYLHVTMGTVVVLVGLFIGGGVLRGAGDSRTPMLVTAFANLVNVALAYGLIYGHFGLPALGAVGSAWATFIARGLGLALLVGALWRGRNGVTIRGKGGWFPDLNVARQVLRIGVPAAMEQILVSTAFLALGIVVAHLGTDMLAAHRVVFNALALSFLPGIGFGIAATALVGQSVGARRIQEGAAATRVATIWAVIWMSAIAALLFIFAPQVLQIFSNDPDVVAAGAAGLRVVALLQPFWAVLFVQSGALRGSGNTSFPLKVSGSGIWVSVGLAWLLIRLFGGGLVSVWAAFLLVAPVIAALMWRRFQRTVREFELPA
ncbi:MAG TPA: MATE family efflux transporter [Roseiflexaceae bacterium]|nr:MATE family efflux transporter [Roseiflexaceae bacterium]